MEEYKKILIDRGIKPTFQRIKIMEYLDQNRTHPTVDMIYAALFKKVPTLSKTTVYNTLDILRKNGLVHALSITDTELRFDYHTEPHHHFLCRKCGRIIDLDIKCPYQESMEVGEHKLEEIHGYFKGICKDCLGEENK